MYTLYYLPDTCSMATHTVLNMLGQEVELVNKSAVENYTQVSPSNLVPALKDGSTVVTEGASIMLYLLDKHDNTLLAKDGPARKRDIENLMLANATMHPAYGRLFFAAGNIENEEAKLQFFAAAASAINTLWKVVENKLKDEPFLGGAKPSAADILLSIYSRWGSFFPVDIKIGLKTQKMIDAVLSSEAFKKAQAAESQDQAAA